MKKNLFSFLTIVLFVTIFLFGCSTATTDNPSDSSGSGNTNPTTPPTTNYGENITQIKLSTTDFYSANSNMLPEMTKEYQIKTNAVGILPVSNNTDVMVKVDDLTLDSVLTDGFYQVDVGNVGQSKQVKIETFVSGTGEKLNTYTLNITHVDAYDNDATLSSITTEGLQGTFSPDVMTYTAKPTGAKMVVSLKRANQGSTCKFYTDFFINGERCIGNGTISQFINGFGLLYNGSSVTNETYLSYGQPSHIETFSGVRLAYDYCTGMMDRSKTVHKTTIKVTSKDGTQTKTYTVYIDCVNVIFPPSYYE